MDREACPVKGTAYSGIGGQAVMEGVMMRNKDLYAVAVRKPDGEIVVKKAEYKGVIKSDTPYKIPVIRGVLSFIDSLVLGLSTLNYSSDIYIQSEETEKEDGEKPESEEAGKKASDVLLTTVITVVAIILALGLFMVLPYLASLIFRPLTGEGIVLSLIEGVIRMLIFIGYILLISRMEDIRR
ncbi:MAG: DUF1385 domain-containing protein, partial [Lachnospiraceae bacterium]|nr:DUF1385 domain-containing protein [Lachnospiraceae bacterium]